MARHSQHIKSISHTETTNSSTPRASRRSRSGTRSAGTDDQGFTLIELLIALLILPLVVGGVSVMLLSVLRSQSAVSNRITGSIDTQALSATLDRDVQSSNFITTKATPSCGSTGTQILGVESSGTLVSISYDIVPLGSKFSLWRYSCSAGNVVTPTGDTQISDNVPSSQSVSVTCSSSCSPATSWLPSSSVSLVKMSVTETTTLASYAISATPRMWSSASAGLGSNPFPITPLTVLGNGTCPQTVLATAGSASISISNGAGAIMDDSTCSPSIVTGGASRISAGSIGTADPTPAAAISRSGSSQAPTPTFQPAVPDPFASLGAPATPTTAATGSCPGSGGTCSPGNFTSALSLNGASLFTFASGTYVFDQPVSINGSATVIFGSGTYDFRQGLTILGSGDVTFNSGTYIFSGATATSNALTVSGSGSLSAGTGGILLYIDSGTTTFRGSGHVALSGLSQYDGVALWQAKSDTNAMSLGGSSCTTANYGGIYAAGATIAPFGSAQVTAAFIVAESVSFSGSSALFVG